MPLPPIPRLEVDAEVRWLVKVCLALAGLAWLLTAGAGYDLWVHHHYHALSPLTWGVGSAFFLSGLAAVLYILCHWPGDDGHDS